MLIFFKKIDKHDIYHSVVSVIHLESLQKLDPCVTLCSCAAWELINIERRMATLGREALKRSIMGLHIIFKAGTGLCWCNVAVIIFQPSRQMRNTLLNVRTDHLTGKPQWLQKPICDNCNIGTAPVPLTFITALIGPHEKSNKIKQ